MKDIRKRFIGVVMIIALLLGVLAVPPQDAQAADINKKAGKAFAKALEQKKISYNGYYCLCDIDSDGVKELIVEGKGVAQDQVFWKYEKGKVLKLGEFGGADGRLTYDKKKKTFWCCGDGDGAWMQSYKLKNGHFKATGIGYYINLTSDGKRAEKHTKKGTKKISVKKYREIENNIWKNNVIGMKKLGKSKLILKLQNKKLYTPKELHLSTDIYKCKGIEIKKLTAKSIQYKKVKVQSRDSGEGWYPYDNKTYQMKYSKKIDVYLLVDSGSGWGSKVKLYKAYSSMDYRKIKKCFNDGITTFALIKDKKGEVTKMVQLYAA
ncbi:MAG: hypothetical protein NC489_39180 [Ruminococcus flavefaciens]|nr:hypothetical protein [Ruminococcus flavefaciens]